MPFHWFCNSLRTSIVSKLQPLMSWKALKQATAFFGCRCSYTIFSAENRSANKIKCPELNKIKILCLVMLCVSKVMESTSICQSSV